MLKGASVLPLNLMQMFSSAFRYYQL